MSVDSAWGRRFLCVIDPARVTAYGGAISGVVEVLLCNSDSPTEWRDADDPNAAKEGGDDVRVTKDRAGTTELPVERTNFARDNNPANSVTEVYTKLTDGLGVAVDSGTTTSASAFKLIQTGQNFLTTVTVGDVVLNTTDSTIAEVLSVDSDTQLTLHADIMASGENFTIAPSQNKFYTWYKNAAASKPAVTDANGRNAVWTNYEGVWHMDGTGDVTDATGNGHTATENGTCGSIAAPNGQGYARTLGGSSDSFSVADAAALSVAQDWTYQLRGWADSGGAGSWRALITKNRPSVNVDEWVGIWHTAGTPQWHFRVALSSYNDQNISQDAWEHLHMRWDYGTDFQGYINAVENCDLSIAAGDPADGSDDLEIGSSGSVGEYWDGRIDEVRISQEIRAANKIAFDEEMWDDPGNVLLYGTPEDGLGGAGAAVGIVNGDGLISKGLLGEGMLP